jgi:hypothetical protein
MYSSNISNAYSEGASMPRDIESSSACTKEPNEKVRSSQMKEIKTDKGP